MKKNYDTVKKGRIPVLHTHSCAERHVDGIPVRDTFLGATVAGMKNLWAWNLSIEYFSSSAEFL
jgi:hypothetical protein